MEIGIKPPLVIISDVLPKINLSLKETPTKHGLIWLFLGSLRILNVQVPQKLAKSYNIL